MTHYVCTGCRGVSESPGVCQTPDCAQNGDMLEECNCEDDRHQELLAKPEQLEEDTV